MATLSSILPIIIYMLLIIFLVVAIIIGIKLVFALNKIDALVDDVTAKVKTLDRVFTVIDFASDKVTSLGENIISFVTKMFGKIFKKKLKDMEEDEDE
jgi:hypothetical protein